MKKISLSFFLIMSSYIAIAQRNNLKLFLNPNVALPTGDFASLNKTGYGLGGRISYGLSDQIDLLLNINLLYFGGKSYNNNFPDLQYPNLVSFDSKFGFRYNKNNFFAGLAVGRAGFVGSVTTSLYSSSESNTGLGITPEIGYQFSVIDISANYNLNFVSYQGYGNFNYAGIKLGIRVLNKQLK